MAVAAVLAAWAASRRSEPGAIRELPAAERRALYERTLNTLESSCDPQTQPKGLEAFCREQADFIVQFPECDRACVELAERHEPGPTR